LQLEQGHRVLGVVEVAGDGGPGAVAGDPPVGVPGRDSRLPAKPRDQASVQILDGDPLGTVAEEQGNPLPGASVEEVRLGGALGLPGDQGATEERIHGLGEGGARLVGWHVEQADRLLVRSVRLRLPANAAEAKPDDLVRAQAAEEPGEGQGPHHPEGILSPRRKVGTVEVQPRPEQLCPAVVGDHSGVRLDERLDIAWCGQGAAGVESRRDPPPLNCQRSGKSGHPW
jgi:hypothetical protein